MWPSLWCSPASLHLLIFTRSVPRWCRGLPMAQGTPGCVEVVTVALCWVYDYPLGGVWRLSWRGLKAMPQCALVCACLAVFCLGGKWREVSKCYRCGDCLKALWEQHHETKRLLPLLTFFLSRSTKTFLRSFSAALLEVRNHVKLWAFGKVPMKVSACEMCPLQDFKNGSVV